MIFESGPWLLDCLEEHWEILESLWIQRQAALRSPDYDAISLRRLEGRIENHSLALVEAGDAAFPFLEPALKADDVELTLASSYVCLKAGREDLAFLVLGAFLEAEGKAFAGLTLGLSYANIDKLIPALKKQMTAPGPSHRSLACAEILAFHGPVDFPLTLWEAWIADNAPPEQRRQAWHLAGRTSAVKSFIPFQKGMVDKDAAVRHEAGWSAAWRKLPGVIDSLQKIATQPDPDNIGLMELWAVVAMQQEADGLLSLAQNPKWGPLRWKIMGALGHPRAIPLLLEGMTDKDPSAAQAAGQAFSKITGLSLPPLQRVFVPPPTGKEPDDFEKEFLDEAQIPNVEVARAAWKSVEANFQKSPRWARGLRVEGLDPKQAKATLDLESRWEFFLRATFQGTWQGSPIEWDKFPQT